jgi:hypothetical protein
MLVNGNCNYFFLPAWAPRPVRSSRPLPVGLVRARSELECAAQAPRLRQVVPLARISRPRVQVPDVLILFREEITYYPLDSCHPHHAPCRVGAADAHWCTRTLTTAMGCGASAPAGPIAGMSPAHLQKWLASEGLTKQAPALEAGACTRPLFGST